VKWKIPVLETCLLETSLGRLLGVKYFQGFKRVIGFQLLQLQMLERPLTHLREYRLLRSVFVLTEFGADAPLMGLLPRL
jgi:hypothetical protein